MISLLAFHLFIGSGVIGLLINLLIFALVVMVILWVLRMLGVPENIVRVICAILALVLILSLFSGCAGYNVGGGLSYTYPDGSAVSGNVVVTRLSDGKTIIKPSVQ